MSSLAELPELVGFFSYSREDDDAFKGMLSALRDGIQRELGAQLGRSKRAFRLWQDQTAIAPGKLWESEIKTAIDELFFFLPIVTPRSVSSKYCKFEFESFLAREKAIGRGDLIFPILYISVAALENEAKWRDDPVLSTIGRRQYVDWRPLRHLDVQSTAVREQIERLCQKIVESLNAPWTSPEERQRMEEAKARQQAEEEARRLEAEAKRSTEEEQHRRQAEAEARRRAEEERRRHKAEAKRLADAEERRKQTEVSARKRAEEEPGRQEAGARNRGSAQLGRWRTRVAIGAAVVAVLLLIGWGGYAFFRHTVERRVQQAELKWEEERKAAEVEAKRKVEEAEQQRLAAAKAEQERRARAAEADAKRKAEEAERQRLTAAKAEQERQARAAAEAETKRKAEEAERQRLAAAKAEQERQARAAAEAETKRKAEQAERLPPHEDNNQRDSPQPNETRGAWLGVKVQPVTDEIAESLKLKPARGALVVGVDGKSPAKPAGIEPGDVIVKFDGKDIKEMRDLPRIVGDTAIGKDVELIIVCKGREEKRRVQLGALPIKRELSSTSDGKASSPLNQETAATNYPTRPITMIVPFAVGGASDILGRILAQRMSEIVGHEVAVENIAGEGGAEGSKRVADATPDGYRFLFGSVSTNVLYQVLHTTPRYDAAAFTPVILVAEIPLVLMARQSLEIGNLKEFLTYARANQSTLQYGSGGTGTLSHLACARFNGLAGISPRHVPSPGIGPALQNLLGNRVDYFCETASTAQKMVGKVKFIATMGQERSKVLPDVPTALEQSALDIDITYWSAIFLPNGVPSNIVHKLHDIVVAVMNTPVVRDKFEAAGAALVLSDRATPQYLGQFTSSKIRKWSATVKASGLVLR